MTNHSQSGLDKTPLRSEAEYRAEKAGYTPGPWKWGSGVVPPDGPDRYASIYADGGDTIIAEFNEIIPQGNANACLIAAAPDLLAAIKPLIDEIEHGGSSAIAVACMMQDARAAISKAAGAPHPSNALFHAITGSQK